MLPEVNLPLHPLLLGSVEVSMANNTFLFLESQKGCRSGKFHHSTYIHIYMYSIHIIVANFGAQIQLAEVTSAREGLPRSLVAAADFSSCGTVANSDQPWEELFGRTPRFGRFSGMFFWILHETSPCTVTLACKAPVLSKSKGATSVRRHRCSSFSDGAANSVWWNFGAVPAHDIWVCLKMKEIFKLIWSLEWRKQLWNSWIT